MPLTLEAIRAQFPALASGFVYMDNAGGSQVPGVVADAIRDYMLSNYAQIGGDYPASVYATENVARAHCFIETLMGGEDKDRVILGPSTSALLRTIADAYALAWPAHAEVIVAENGHEANISPWLYLRDRGFTVHIWECDPETGSCSVDGLRGLLNANTKLVCFPQVSNILGRVEDYSEFIRVAHEAGAKVLVDGVAYAPHLPMRVAEWGADWYVFSTYKVFGPHMAALWGTHETLAELTGPNHSIIERANVPYKFELGGVNHEGCAGLNALAGYFALLSGRGAFDREAVVEAMTYADRLERPLTNRFVEFLGSKSGVTLLGPNSDRLPIVAWHSDRTPAHDLSLAAARAGLGIKWGNFYSYRLLERMGFDTKCGVARASFAHYNTLDEVDRLISVLDPLL